MSDKNLYRGIRLGRIVNSNGRVIGSIVKKGSRIGEGGGMGWLVQEDEEKYEESRRKGKELEGFACLHNFLS